MSQSDYSSQSDDSTKHDNLRQIQKRNQKNTQFQQPSIKQFDQHKRQSYQQEASQNQIRNEHHMRNKILNNSQPQQHERLRSVTCFPTNNQNNNMYQDEFSSFNQQNGKQMNNQKHIQREQQRQEFVSDQDNQLCQRIQNLERFAYKDLKQAIDTIQQAENKLYDNITDISNNLKNLQEHQEQLDNLVQIKIDEQLDLEWLKQKTSETNTICNQLEKYINQHVNVSNTIEGLKQQVQLLQQQNSEYQNEINRKKDEFATKLEALEMQVEQYENIVANIQNNTRQMQQQQNNIQVANLTQNLNATQFPPTIETINKIYQIILQQTNIKLGWVNYTVNQCYFYFKQQIEKMDPTDVCGKLGLYTEEQANQFMNNIVFNNLDDESGISNIQQLDATIKAAQFTRTYLDLFIEDVSDVSVETWHNIFDGIKLEYCQGVFGYLTKDFCIIRSTFNNMLWTLTDQNIHDITKIIQNCEVDVIGFGAKYVEVIQQLKIRNLIYSYGQNEKKQIKFLNEQHIKFICLCNLDIKLNQEFKFRKKISNQYCQIYIRQYK